MDFVAKTAEAAGVLGISQRTLERRCRSGAIRHAEKVGGSWAINLTKEFPALGLERDASEPLQRLRGDV